MIDWEDKFLFLCGFYVPYYWLLRGVRKQYIKGNLTRKEVYGMLGVKE